MTETRTLVDIFRGVERLEKPDLLLEKRDGTWRPISSADFAARVRALHEALAILGVQPGGRVALLSENRPEWSVVDFACQTFGAVLVPIFPTMVSEQTEYLLKDSGATVAFVSTSAQAQKVLDARPRCRSLAHVFAFDPDGLAGVRPFAEILEEGRKAHAADAAASDRRADARRPDTSRRSSTRRARPASRRARC